MSILNVTHPQYLQLQVTSWQIPAEVAELRKKQEELAGNAGDVGPPAEKSTISFTINVPAALTGGREAIGHKALAANSALDLIKKKLQDPGAPVTSSLLSASVAGPTGVLNVGTAVDDNIGKGTGAEGGNGKPLKGDQVSTDDDSDSDDEDLGPTKEQKVLRFKVKVDIVVPLQQLSGQRISSWPES
jgi:transcription elongation regulator 1